MAGEMETELLYQALGSAFGIEVETDDYVLARQRLYRARVQAQDADLDRLQIRRSNYNPSGALWIVKGPQPNG